MKFETAKRLSDLPVYLFARLDKMIQEKRAKGIDVINLGIGDPDLPTPDYIIDDLCKEARDPANHRYSSYFGMPAFRQAVAQWYNNRFGVQLDGKSEVVMLIGSKEGIGHLSWCCINPGDVALVPDPCYPVYGNGVILAGGENHWMPLKAENNFLPDFSAIPSEVAKKSKLMFLCYPNNPTGAIAPDSFFHEAIAFAKEYDILIAHDVAYCDIAFDGYRPPSFLQYPGAKEVGVEFGSASKPYNMTGWRIGWCAGNPDAVEALGRLKSNLDTGQFQAVQKAAITALLGDQSFPKKMCDVYKERRDICVEGLNAMGWNLEKPKAAFYIWAPVPSGYTSGSFAEMIFDKADVVVTPGAGYGPSEADGYIRISLTVPTDRLKEAIERIRQNVGKVSF